MHSSGLFFGYFISSEVQLGDLLTTPQRFRTYNLPLATASPEALAWMKKMWSDTVFKALAKDYFRQAEDLETTVEKYDDKFKGNPEIQYGRFKEGWEFTAEH